MKDNHYILVMFTEQGDINWTENYSQVQPEHPQTDTIEQL